MRSWSWTTEEHVRPVCRDTVVDVELLLSLESSVVSHRWIKNLLEVEPLLCVHHSNPVTSHLWHTILSAESNLSLLTSLTLLCCQNDNTVSSTGTVDSSWRSVLQHCHWLDIVRVQCSESAWRDWSTIEDDERLRATRDWANTTKTDVYRLTWFTTWSEHLQTSNLSLQSVCNVCYRLLLESFTSNSCNRTYNRTKFLGTTVAQYNQFVKHLRIRSECNLNICLDRNFLSLHTQVRNNQRLWTVRNIVQSKLTVHVSGCTNCCTLNQNSGTNYWQTIFTRNDSNCHLRNLGICQTYTYK